jgi:hypothetical protein
MRDVAIEITQIVRQIVELFVRGDLEKLDQLTKRRLESAQAILVEFRTSKLSFAMPPEEAFERLAYFPLDGPTEGIESGRHGRFDIYEVASSDRPRWAIDFDLWTEEQGLSDYTLQLDVERAVSGELDVALRAVHVL